MDDIHIEPRLLLKVTPPRASRRMLERATLSLASPQLADRRIIRLEAPAGFGKTSLLAQWRRSLLAAAGVAVAWLSADDEDDPARFSQALALAMERAYGRAAFGRLGQGEMPGSGEFDRLTAWLAEVANAGTESALIIDEVESLPAASQRSLDYILRNLPANLRVILAMRKPLPALRLTELVARGEVVQLSPDALRFTLSETLAVMRAQLGGHIDANAAAAIHELTRGWPLGLQLAIAAIEKGSDPRELIAHVGLQRGNSGQYFFESLLARLPPQQRDFLVVICVTDRVHAGLAAALTGRADAGTLLDELRTSTPILADQEGEWAIIHPMAREFLRVQFARLPEERRRAVHASASAWLAQHHLEEEAGRHALAAGRPERAWELAEQSLYEELLRGHVSLVREWFERTPLSGQEQRPRLLLAAGWSYALGASHERAAELARRVLDQPDATEEERARAKLMLSAAATYFDRLDEAAALVDEWSQSRLPLSATQDVNGSNQRAFLALMQGHPAESRRILQHAGTHLPALVSGYQASIEGMSHLWEGQVTLAAQVLGRALARTEQSAGRRDLIPVLLASPLALALTECGEMRQAELVVANRLDAIEYLGGGTSMICGYTAAARLAKLRGQEARSYELLNELELAGANRAMPRVQAAALGELIRLHSLQEHPETCAGLMRRLDAVVTGPIRAGGILAEPLQLVRDLAAAYAQAAHAQWSAVLDGLDAAAARAERLARGGDRVEIGLLRARALHALGRDCGAVLNEAVSLAETFGLRRMLDEEPLAQLRRSLRPAPEPAGPRPAGARDPDILVPLHVAPTPLLTPKERDILGLLVHRLSNKQIANALDVGDATVKWHLKNVFSKLHAGSREHAVQRARMLGILDA